MFDMEIIWSNQARKDYFTVLDYLNKNWGQTKLEVLLKNGGGSQSN